MFKRERVGVGRQARGGRGREGEKQQEGKEGGKEERREGGRQAGGQSNNGVV